MDSNQRKFIIGKHPHQNVEMVAHQAKSYDFNEIQRRILPDQIQHKILLNTTKWEPI